MGQDLDESEYSGLQTKLLNFLKPRLKILAGLTLTLSSLALLAQVYFIFELINCFRLHYLFAGLLFLGFFVWQKEKLFSAICGLIIIINFIFIAPLFYSSETNTGKPNKKILLLNVFTANEQTSLVVDYVKKENPDYVSLLEINDRWEKEIIESLSKDYPYYRSIPRSDNFGLMFLSKTRFKGKMHWSKAEVPFIEAKYHDQTIWLAHPLPPVSSNYFRMRNLVIDELSEAINPNTKNIVCGDFNAVPWSPFLNTLKQKVRIKNCADGYGINHTWPANLPFPGISIDHCFISHNATVQSFRRGPYLGSDHYPLVVEFSF